MEVAASTSICRAELSSVAGPHSLLEDSYEEGFSMDKSYQDRAAGGKDLSFPV